MKILIFGQNFDFDIATFSWDTIYEFLGIKDFMYFIMDPAIQNTLFPAKVVLILFTLFLFCAVMYFYKKSSYIYYHFFQGFDDMVTLKPSGVIDIDNRWKKIVKKTESGQESEYKLSIIEADEFLNQLLEEKGADGETFEEMVMSNKKIISNAEDVLIAHQTRNSIVYEPDYKLESEYAKKVLADFEKAIKNISSS